MSELIVTEFVTLDGVMEAPGGEPTHPHSGWVGVYMTPEQGEYKMQEIVDAGSLLLGRVTYDGFAEAWPQREGEFADRMNTLPKYVVSSTLAEPLAWNNSTSLGGDAVAAVTELKRQPGGPIFAMGSATLVRTLLENDLVDELRLMVFPLIVGGGLRCFPESFHKAAFTPAASTTFSSGVTAVSYRRAES